MSKQLPILTVPLEDLRLPTADKGVAVDTAKNRRKALEKHAKCIQNREPGATSFELGVAEEGIKEFMNFPTDEATNIFITDLHDRDFVNDETVVGGALVEQAEKMKESAIKRGDASAEADAKDILRCLVAASDSEELVSNRLIAAQRNVKDWPKTRKQALANRGPNELDYFGDPLEDRPEVHHKIPKSVKPEHTLNPENLVAANRTNHRKNHSKNNKSGTRLLDENHIADPSSLIGCSIDTDETHDT